MQAFDSQTDSFLVTRLPCIQSSALKMIQTHYAIWSSTCNRSHGCKATPIMYTYTCRMELTFFIKLSFDKLFLMELDKLFLMDFCFVCLTYHTIWWTR